MGIEIKFLDHPNYIGLTKVTWDVQTDGQGPAGL